MSYTPSNIISNIENTSKELFEDINNVITWENYQTKSISDIDDFKGSVFYDIEKIFTQNFLNKVSEVLSPGLKRISDNYDEKGIYAVASNKKEVFYSKEDIDNLLLKRGKLLTKQLLRVYMCQYIEATRYGTKNSSNLLVPVSTRLDKIKYSKERRIVNTISKYLPELFNKSGKSKDNMCERIGLSSIVMFIITLLMIRENLNVREGHSFSFPKAILDIENTGIVNSKLIRIALSKIIDINTLDKIAKNIYIKQINKLLKDIVNPVDYEQIKIGFTINKESIDTIIDYLVANMGNRFIINRMFKNNIEYMNIIMKMSLSVDKITKKFNISLRKQPVKYNNIKKVTISYTGRAFIKDGLQNCKRDLKELIFTTGLNAYNYDMKNSQITMMGNVFYDFMNLADKYYLPYRLNDYKRKTDNRIDKINQEYKILRFEVEYAINSVKRYKIEDLLIKYPMFNKQFMKKILYSYVFGAEITNPKSDLFKKIRKLHYVYWEREGSGVHKYQESSDYDPKNFYSVLQELREERIFKAVRTLRKIIYLYDRLKKRYMTDEELYNTDRKLPKCNYTTPNGVSQLVSYSKHKRVIKKMLTAYYLQGYEAYFIYTLMGEISNSITGEYNQIYSYEYDGIVTSKPIKQSIIDLVNKEFYLPVKLEVKPFI